jgi:TM2 domain-containing membrane protein YozV
LRSVELVQPPNAAVAATLSLLVPGAGQLYAGRPLSGLVWFVVVTLGYLMLIVPGVLLHIVCVASAASAAHRARTTTAP